MENRNRKRTELEIRLRSDKRPCSSSDSRSISSCSSLQNHTICVNSISKPPDFNNMEASISSSFSDRSETEEDDTDNDSFNDDDDDGDYSVSDTEEDESDQNQRNLQNQDRFGGDEEKFLAILASLMDGNAGSDTHLVTLTELCDFLSFRADFVLTGFMLESLAPILVALAKNESNPDIMLLAIRAITYLCDAFPRSARFLVQNDVVSALCARLMAIEYLDLAEQCLLALEKISRNHPVECLQAGAIMAVLNYIDFFSISIQRVALSIVVNICKKLPSACSSQFVEAVPVLCNLLQYEDQKLVENVATCLIRIVDRMSHSSEMLNELFNNGLIQRVINLIAMNNGTTLSQPIYTGLIGLLSRLASGSAVAVTSLFELNITSTLKHMLSRYDISHSIAYSLVGGDVQSDQVREVLKLINELLPPMVRKDEDNQVVEDKENILLRQPELLRQFGIDILPLLIQVVNSGANLHVCYGCLYIINKLFYFCKLDMLQDLLKTTNISSFLAGVFARKDHHVLILALKIVKTLLEDHCDLLLNSFMKEGVVYAIDALLTPSMFSTHLSSSSNQNLAEKDDIRCLCYAYSSDKPSSSEKGTCKLENDSVHSMAKHIKVTFFATESHNSKIGLTQILQKLRTSCGDLSEMVNISMNSDICTEQEENMSHILGQIMAELTESMSTFEFIESGMVKSSVNYLTNGRYLKEKEDHCELLNHLRVIPKRFETFARFSLSSTSQHWEDMPLAVLVRKLQNALSSLENFPVILSDCSRSRYNYATIPEVHRTKVPCIRVRFVKEDGEASLSMYDGGVENLEPFSSFDAVESFLWPRVRSADQLQGLSEDTQKLIFYLNGRQIDRTLTIYQAILQLQLKAEQDMIVGERFWDEVYKVTYRNAVEPQQVNHQNRLQNVGLRCDLGNSSDLYEILFLLKILEGLNKSAFQLMSRARSNVFSEGKDDDLDNLRVTVQTVPNTEFISNKLTEKLEQQMRDSLAMSIGCMPSWCGQLMASCPFLFGFEARCKYFTLTSWPKSANYNSNTSNDRRSLVGSLPRKKFQVCRCHILHCASKMMDFHAHHKVILEVEYHDEVGTGLGPTMEFYTLVSAEFQKIDLGMWREDISVCTSESGLVVAPLGLFPRPWSDGMNISNGIEFSEVIKNFVLLGQVVAKALQDRRVLDLHLSKTFYKLILQQELDIYDIQLFDPGLGKVLLEFQALVGRKRILESVSGTNTTLISGSCFRNTRIEDLCLDFSLPGYPDYLVTSEYEHKMVNMMNLEDYVSMTVDATINSGIVRQMEAFKSGFNQVFPIESLQIFTEEELEHLLCGERDAWDSKELFDQIKFDHGYNASSPPIINFLEIIREFEGDQRRAFFQFVTGAPQLPPGGLASLNPKLTIVRKHCSGEWADGDLPSVMTCANYLKLPPYSSKEIMRERLLYAIKEGQGSFHLS